MRFLSGLLYSVKPGDPLTLVAVSALLMAVALLASYIPARQAAKVDPMVALRQNSFVINDKQLAPSAVFYFHQSSGIFSEHPGTPETKFFDFSRIGLQFRVRESASGTVQGAVATWRPL